MKKLSLLLLVLLASIQIKAQDISELVQQDYNMRTGYVQSLVKTTIEKKKADNTQDAYVKLKASGLSFLAKSMTKEERQPIIDLFKEQAKKFMPALEIAIEKSDISSNKDLIKLLLRNEDDFRKLLSADQLKLYKERHAEAEVEGGIFDALFFSDEEYLIYQKIL